MFGFLLEIRAAENIVEQVPVANDGEDRHANQGIYVFVLLNKFYVVVFFVLFSNVS